MKEFLNHPLVISFLSILLTTFLGKIFILPKVLQNKIVDLKIKIINVFIRQLNYFREIKFIHNRLVNTKNYVEEKNNPKLINVYNKSFPKDTARMSKIVLELIPLDSEFLDTNLKFYFNDKKLESIYKTYVEEKDKICSFLLNYFLDDIKETIVQKKSWDDFEELNLDRLFEIQKDMVRNIKKSKVIFSGFKI